MKTKRWLFLGTALAVPVVAALVSTAIWSGRQTPLTIVSAQRMADSHLVTLEIQNNAPGRIRLYAVDLLARLGTNWASVGQVRLDDTNSTQGYIRINVNFPERPRPWKAKLVYMPAFSPPKLLWYRLSETWKTTSLREGFSLTGWEGERHLYSPEIAE